VRLSLFWRTFVLIALVVVASLLAWLQVFRATEVQPRAERFAWEIAAVVNVTRAGLTNTQGAQRRELLSALGTAENIRIRPADYKDRISAWPDPEFGGLMEAKLMELLGEETRLAGRVNGVDGLWIRFEMQDELYWMLLDPERLARQANRNWIGWFGIALGLALAASLAISRVINRPLASLAGAIDRVSRGETPPTLDENGPTELALINRRFNAMAAELAALDADRAEALAGISHDIRTPLTRLRLEIEMSSADRSTRDSMAEEIDRIDAIVRQFVEFARPLDSEPALDVGVRDVVDSVLDAYRHGPEADDLIVTEAVDASLNWRGSQTVLTRILSNLVENAYRYGKDAKGSTCIELAAQRRANGIELTVRDHGPGVPADQLERLIRPFTRLDAERHRHGGSGLGLSIVARLSRRYSGDLRLELPPDGGLLARVRLDDAPSPTSDEVRSRREPALTS
jgi:two-component system osmolarity sensor histidine kinase EnvZ